MKLSDREKYPTFTQHWSGYPWIFLFSWFWIWVEDPTFRSIHQVRLVVKWPIEASKFFFTKLPAPLVAQRWVLDTNIFELDGCYIIARVYYVRLQETTFINKCFLKSLISWPSNWKRLLNGNFLSFSWTVLNQYYNNNKLKLGPRCVCDCYCVCIFVSVCWSLGHAEQLLFSCL